jgi:hypothetical protein
VTPSFTCLGFTFAVEAADRALERLVADLYAPFASDDPASVVYTVVEWAGAGGPHLVLYANAERVRSTGDPATVFAHLVWEIGQQVTTRPSRWLLLHAAAAELDGRAILLPARSGAGKSTLVAGLVSSGMGYLTDDVTAVDPEAGSVHPYPKPISVARALWPLVGRRTPVAAGADRYLGPEGFLGAADLGGAPGEPSTPALVVIPRYVPDEPTCLTEVGPTAALVQIREQSFNIGLHDPDGLRAVAGLVERCRCLRLEYGVLGDAVARLTSELHDIRSR